MLWSGATRQERRGPTVPDVGPGGLVSSQTWTAAALGGSCPPRGRSGHILNSTLKGGGTDHELGRNTSTQRLTNVGLSSQVCFPKC
jgi:hypothetical protein